MAQHRQCIVQFREQGKLSAAGPMEQPGELVGMVIYRPIPVEEAERLGEADPAVKGGRAAGGGSPLVVERPCAAVVRGLNAVEVHIAEIAELEFGDAIYFNDGEHNNLRITFGPILRF